MATIRYTKDHEYIAVEGDIGTVGITDYAQSQLGDVVFVELPEPRQGAGKGGEAAVVECVKAASEVYAPVSGEVVEVNAGLPDAPGDGQRGSARQGLVRQAQARRPGRARRPDGRGRLQDAYRGLIRCAICPSPTPTAATCWRKVGVAAIDDLFADVPADKLLQGLLDLPRAKGELEVERILGAHGGAQRRRRPRCRSSSAPAPTSTMCRPASTISSSARSS